PAPAVFWAMEQTLLQFFVVRPSSWTRFLKGTNPADLPIERVSKFQFILNRKAAKALGFEVPQSILLRADEVIE
ncbi:MAG: ABC transporter substrate binding protein, partial [Pseudolabrys sp.]